MAVLPSPPVSRLVDLFTSMDELLRQLLAEVRRLNRSVEVLSARVGELSESVSVERISITRRATVQYQPPPLVTPSPPQQPAVATKIVALPPGVEFADSYTYTLSERVEELQLPKGDILMLTAIDGAVWWSPKQFIDTGRGAVYLQDGATIVLSRVGWEKLYARADTGSARLLVAVFSTRGDRG